jgi:hypothetical protein
VGEAAAPPWPATGCAAGRGRAGPPLLSCSGLSCPVLPSAPRPGSPQCPSSSPRSQCRTEPAHRALSPPVSRGHPSHKQVILAGTGGHQDQTKAPCHTREVRPGQSEPSAHCADLGPSAGLRPARRGVGGICTCPGVCRLHSPPQLETEKTVDFSKPGVSLMPVAHTCNPSYSGGRDQEDRGSRPAWGKRVTRP